MSITALALFATLVIDGQVYDGVATAHTYYYPGPSGFPELHIQTERDMTCSGPPPSSSRESRVILNRRVFTAAFVGYMPDMNAWVIETRSGDVVCSRG